MTQEQAFEELQAIFPSENITVERDRKIRTGDGTFNSYWLFADCLPRGVISSDRSWEHLIAIAHSGNEKMWAAIDELVPE
jgi:hypothetical protein